MFSPLIHAACSVFQYMPRVQSSNTCCVFISPIHAACSFLQYMPRVHSSNTCCVFISPIHAACSVLQYMPRVHFSNTCRVFISPIHNVCVSANRILLQQYKNRMNFKIDFVDTIYHLLAEKIFQLHCIHNKGIGLQI